MVGAGAGVSAEVGAVASAVPMLVLVRGPGRFFGPSLQICSIFPRFMACKLELLQNYIFLPLWLGLRPKRQEIDALLQDSTFPQLPPIEFLQICSNQERTNGNRLLSRAAIQPARQTLFRLVNTCCILRHLFLYSWQLARACTGAEKG